MAEEKINAPDEIEAEQPVAPKKRGGGRKKSAPKTEAEINTTSAPDSSEQPTEQADESSAQLSILNEADSTEEINESAETKDAEKEDDTVSFSATEKDSEQNEAEDKMGEDEENVTEAPQESCEGEAEAHQEVCEGEAEADIESVEGEEPISAEADTHSVDDTEYVSAEAEGEVTSDSDEQNKTERKENLFFEHFSDTAELTYLSDSVKTLEEEQLTGTEGEQLSLFGDEAEKCEDEELPSSESAENVRAPKEKRRHIPSPDEKEYTPEKPRRVDTRFDLVELFVYTLVVIMLLTTFLFKHSIVSGPSMMKTLNDGDHLIISDFLYEPKQYDIVVIQDLEAHKEGAIVKRIIAVGGQTVRLERRLIPEKSDVYLYYETTVYVGGQLIDESFEYYSASDYVTVNKSIHNRVDFKYIPGSEESGFERYEYEIFEYTVPEGEVYVLGDHRNDSKDSRNFGSVSVDKILGRVIIRIYPFAEFGTVK